MQILRFYFHCLSYDVVEICSLCSRRLLMLATVAQLLTHIIWSLTTENAIFMDRHHGYYLGACYKLGILDPTSDPLNQSLH